MLWPSEREAVQSVVCSRILHCKGCRNNPVVDIIVTAA